MDRVADKLDYIGALIEQKKLESEAPPRMLQAEYNAMTMKRGNKKFAKPCKGTGFCKNLLCEHMYAIPP